MPHAPMNIGEASRRTGLTARAIRLYEALGIVGAPQRGDGGYRRFTEEDIRMLAFVRKARQFGFDLESIRQLVGCLRAGRHMGAEVDRLLRHRIAEVRRREAETRAIRETLESVLVESDHDAVGCGLMARLLGDEAPDHAVAMPAPHTLADGRQARRSRRPARPPSGLQES